MPAPNTQQMPAIPVPPSIWWRPGSPSSFATGNQETPNWRAYFFWCRQRVCGSFLSWIDLLHAWVCTLHGLWAGHVSGCMETSRANEAWGGMPRIPTSVKSPTFKSFKQVIAMSGSLVSCGGSWLGEPLHGSKTKRWISSCLWPTGGAVCSVFFSPFCQFSKRQTIGHPFAEDLWARARGGEGAKNDRSPRRGTGIRASRPRPPCRAWTARGRHGHWAPGPVISLLVIAAMAMC